MGYLCKYSLYNYVLKWLAIPGLSAAAHFCQLFCILCITSYLWFVWHVKEQLLKRVASKNNAAEINKQKTGKLVTNHLSSTSHLAWPNASSGSEARKTLQACGPSATGSFTTSRTPRRRTSGWERISGVIWSREWRTRRPSPRQTWIIWSGSAGGGWPMIRPSSGRWSPQSTWGWRQWWTRRRGSWYGWIKVWGNA